MKGIYIESGSGVAGEHYAVVYVPRRHRGRFPDSCVKMVGTAEDALEQSSPDHQTYAAKVIGPSRSSEGVMMFYLDCWLNNE